MKKFVFLLFITIPFMLQAQVMKVYQKDGKVIEVDVDNIDRVEFCNKETGGGRVQWHP